MTRPEAWLCGPLPGVSRFMMPAAHALLQSREDIETHASTLSTGQVWVEPGGAPSVGFHLRHIAGSIDRLLTYAAGRSLTEDQLGFLAVERIAGTPPAGVIQLIDAVRAQVDNALSAIQRTPDEALFEARTVGRAKLPTNVFGLLFHIAEHTQRHTGQLIATASVVRGFKT